MLRVRTYVDISSIPNIGLGLFANERITKGTVIWEYTEGLDFVKDLDEVDDMNPIDKEFATTYSYLDVDINKYIFMADNARFFNHSEISPNVDEHGQGLTAKTVANKDIEIGEELLTNYFVFDKTATIKLK